MEENTDKKPPDELPDKVSDSESESGEETNDEEEKDGESSGSDSDSSDSNEKCPICLLSFHEQEIGSPNVCEHAFCVPCIEVWSRSVKTCPIDRKSFTTINVCQSFDDRKLLRTIEVDTNSNKELILIDEEEEDVTLCEICRRSDREDVMLLCDGCNRGYHTDCLTPALHEIPQGSWYCDNCFSSHSSSESDEGEINDLLNELEDVGGHLMELGRLRHQQPRITRTRQSERIRNTILTTTGRRTQVATVRQQPSTSRNSGAVMASTSRASTSTVKPKVVRKKRRKKYRRRTRTVVVEYDLNSDSKFPIATKKVKIMRRRKKRKVKRKTKSCKKSSTSTRRSTKSSAGASSSSATNNLEQNLRGRRSTRASLPAFSLMGPKRDMDVLFSDSEEDESYTRAIASGSSLMLSIRNASHGGNLLRSKKTITAAIEASSSLSSMPNLLDNIMKSQEILHSKGALKKFVIGKSGNISTKRPNPTTTLVVNSATLDTGDTDATVAVKESQSEQVTEETTNNGTTDSVIGSSNDNQSESSAPTGSSAQNSSKIDGKEETHVDIETEKSPKVEQKTKESDEKKVKDELKPLIADLPTLESLSITSAKAGFQYDDDDSDNDCPNFSVYSEETMALLTKPAEGSTTTDNFEEQTDNVTENATMQDKPIDFDEDLVQMSDNDENLQDAGDLAAFNQIPAAEVEEILPDSEIYNQDDQNTPTLDEKYPEDELQSPADRGNQLDLCAEDFDERCEGETPPPKQNLDDSDIRSPEHVAGYRSTDDRQVEAKKSRRKRRSSTDDDDDGDDDKDRAGKKRKKHDHHRKKSKKEHKKRSRSRSRNRKRSRDRDKKHRRRSSTSSRSPTPKPRSRSRPKAKSSRKRKTSRSRSRSLSHRWSPVNKRYSRSKSRSFTPPPITSKKNKKTIKATPAPATSSTKRSTATTKPKDVFKSGKNILVSVNFEKTNKNSKFEYSNDPVAIIDLTNGVKETIPSAKNIIEVSDSENEEEKDRLPDNSLIGAMKVTIENKLKASAPPKPKLQSMTMPQQSVVETTKIASVQPDASKRSGISSAPEKIGKTAAATTVTAVPLTSGYDYLPYSPGSSDYDDLYDDNNMNAISEGSPLQPAVEQPTTSTAKPGGGGGDKSTKKTTFNDLFGQSSSDEDEGTSKVPKSHRTDKKGSKEKYINKVNLQKRAVAEAKLYLKPFFNSKQINKDEYKDILRRAVPKICRGGEIRPQKIEFLIAAYVRTVRHQSAKTATGGSKFSKK